MHQYFIIESNDYLGESGFYLSKDDSVVWLDLAKPSINFYSLKKKKFNKILLKLNKPLGNIYPLKNNKFIISCSSGLYITGKNNNKIIKLGDIRTNQEKKLLNYNDGTISPGKLWIGLSDKKENKKIGYFGFIENNNFIKIKNNFKVSNGPAIDKKNKYFFLSDSASRTIYKYTFNKFKRRKFFEFSISQGYPDGIALDNEGGLWVAHWAGARVSRINKNGKIDFSINLPALNITSVTFVGKKLNYLFITSAKIDTSKRHLEKYIYSGSSFLLKTNFKGQSIPYASIKMLKSIHHLQQ